MAEPGKWDILVQQDNRPQEETQFMNIRKHLLLLSTTFGLNSALLLTGCGQSDSGGTVSGTGSTARVSGPSFYMPSPVVDFGEVADFETRTASVAFTNRGNGVLEVFEVKPTCGCTSTKLEQTTFAPGEGDTINLTFKPKGSGKQSKTVFVMTNDSEKQSHEIIIKAEVIPTLEVTPRSLSFGKIPLGSGAKRTLILQSGNPNYTMGAMNFFGEIKDQLTYNLKETTPPGSKTRKWKLDVELKPGMPWGWYTGSLRISGKVLEGNGGKSIPSTVTVGMNANVQGNLTASDSMFRLLVLPQKQKFSKTIRIAQAQNKPFEVLEATVVNGKPIPMSVLVEPIPESNGSTYDLTLMGNTGTSSGAISGNVLLKTTIKGEEEVLIKIAGSIRKSN